jgi:RNA polymerase sigma factor (sigma-70 family)
MNPRLLPTSRLARSVLRAQSDERLTELARGGSVAAFEALVSRYRRPLLRHCARVVGDADAEEAVQDALLRAHMALARGQDVRSVKPWLHVIAHNAALSIVRARAARPERLHDDSELADYEDRSSEQREDLRDVISAVQSLPVRQRDAIVMRELEGRSYEEIAARLGTSHGAVRQLLHRARHAIRDRVGAVTGFEPLLRSALQSGNGATAARLGALSGGCALTLKVCSVALLPAVLPGAGPGSPPARHSARRVATPRRLAGTRPRGVVAALAYLQRVNPTVAGPQRTFTSADVHIAPAAGPDAHVTHATALTASSRPPTAHPTDTRRQLPATRVQTGIETGERFREDPRRGAGGVWGPAERDRGRPGGAPQR